MARKGKHRRRSTPIKTIRWAIRRRWRWFKKLSKPKKALVLGGPLLAFLIITPLLTYAFYYNDIADQDRLMNANNTGIALTDKNGEVFYSIGKAEHRKVIGLEAISDQTEHALVAAEDKDFYEHGGFSIFRILGSLYANIVAGDATAYGGSTLTQQLAKNTLLTTNKSFLRKYQELTIAMAIEQRYTKDQVLAMYLNSVYFGNNSFGIEDAAQNYFGKKASDLDLAESAMLIGVLPAPSAYSPVEGNPQYAKERQTTVLTRMVKNGYITEAEKNAALAQQLTYQPAKNIDNLAPHFTEMVLNELYDKYGEEVVKRSGYQVKTTLDLNLQRVAVDAVNNNIAHIQANGGSNASVVVVDPKTGEIRVLVGSADYNNEQFGKVNMATSPRQPGSSFKPLYYAKALADGDITPATILRDEKTNFNGYQPENATKRYYGDITVRQALSYSLNIPAVKVMQRVGISSAIDQAKAMGITSLTSASDYGLALALGAGEVPLTEMTGAYATFANGGIHHEETSIQTIEDKFGKTIFRSAEKSHRAISEQGAYLISDILSDNQARAGMFGAALNVYGTDGRVKKVAVKTGTTNDSRDAWTVGYTPNIAAGVWVGNNDNTAMYSGGSDMAGPIWRAIMRAAIGTDDPQFIQPSGIVQETVCISGRRITDVFLTSNVPTGQCKTQPITQPNEEKPKQEEPEPVKPNEVDTDSDGVNDDKDTCPATPEGTEVDENGCPVDSEESPPVTGNGGGNGLLRRIGG